MVIDRATLSHQLADLPVSMHHRGVVATAKTLPNLRQTHLSQFSAEVHRNLTGLDEAARTVAAADILNGEAEVGGGLSHDHHSGDIRAR